MDCVTADTVKEAMHRVLRVDNTVGDDSTVPLLHALSTVSVFLKDVPDRDEATAVQSTPATTFRDALVAHDCGDITRTEEWQQTLTHTLVCAMEQRNDSAVVATLTTPRLVWTQSDEMGGSEDDDDNENDRSVAALDSRSSNSLTQTSLVAATVYVQILCRPGSVGFIDLTAMAALVNVLRRWKAYCTDHVGRKGWTAKAKPKQRSNNQLRASTESSDGLYSSCAMDEDDPDGSSPTELINGGLLLAGEVCCITSSMDFQATWKWDAAEAVWDAMFVVLSTASALGMNHKDEPTAAASNTTKSGTASWVAERASLAIQHCVSANDIHIASSGGTNGRCNDDDSDDEETMAITAIRSVSNQQKRQDTVVTVLRGLYLILTLNDLILLPNGEAGRLVAARLASQTLFGLIHNIVSQGEKTQPGSPIQPLALSTPRRQRPDQMSTTPTPQQQQRGTLSPHNRRVLTTPKLKAKRPRAVGTDTTIPAHQRYRPNAVSRALVGILQQLATTKGLEKATVRTLVVETLQTCVAPLSVHDRRACAQFFGQLCRSKIPVHRLVGVELLGHLLTEPWLWDEDENNESLVVVPDGSIAQHLVQALHGRLLDRTPTIRASSAQAWTRVYRYLILSLSSLQSTGDNNHNIQKQNHGLLAAGMVEESEAIVSSLRCRAISDDKASVRRAACLALVEFLLVGEAWSRCSSDNAAGSVLPVCDLDWPTTSDQDIGILATLCQDSSTMTRRTAAEGLTRLYETLVERSDECHDDPIVVRSLEQNWITYVLTMVLDSETGCAAKAVELVERVVILPILPRSDNHDVDMDDTSKGCMKEQSAWRILAALGGNGASSSGTSRCSYHALRAVLAKTIGWSNTTASGSTTSNHPYAVSIFRTIHRVTAQTLNETTNYSNERSVGVWCLFDAALGHTGNNKVAMNRLLKQSKLDRNVICRSWKLFLDLYLLPETPPKNKAALQSIMRHCLSVLSQLSPSIEAVYTEEVFVHLRSLVGTFQLPTEIIGPAVAALVAIIVATTPKTSSPDDKYVRCSELIRCLYDSCDTKLASFASDDFDIEILSRVLYTVGELAMVGFHAGENNGAEKPSRDDSGNTSVLVRGLHERPTKQLIDFVQAFMTNELPGRENVKTPDSIRAQSFVSFGKFCLRDAVLAKKSLNILARELHGGNHKGNWTVQSNSLLVLGDLCVTHTNMVDRFLPVMAGCLQAGEIDMSTDVLGQPSQIGSALVRKHAVLLLSSLLLQDYIKWRGLLFHRFLVATADDEENVAALAEMVLFGPLLSKHPRLFANNFVESLFVLNRCTAHPIYQAAAVLGDGGSGISVGFEGINLTGEVGRMRRMRMYCMMLSRLSDEDKIGLTARIGKVVLGGALQPGSDLHEVATTSPTNASSTTTHEGALNVLSDALAILACPQIRVGRSTRTNTNGVDDGDIEDPNIAVNNSKKFQVAKGRLLSNVSRKHLIEILLPILCQLKSTLQSSRSPLLKDLMICLLDVYHRYKVEAQECLANDPTTLQEIEYDSHQYKKAQREAKTPRRNRSMRRVSESEGSN